MKYSVLIAEKRDGDKIVIDINELNEFIDQACKESYDKGFWAGMKVVQQNDYPWKVVPTWGDKTTPDYLHKITCDSTTPSASVTMKLERDPENPFHIIGAHSL